MRLWIILFFVCLAASVHAQTITSSSGGGTVTLKVDNVAVNTTTRTVAVTVTVTWASVFGRWGEASMGTGSGTGITLSPQSGSGTTTVTRNYTYPVGGSVTVNFYTSVYEPSGDNPRFDRKNTSITRPAADAAQTVTITPSTASILAGNSQLFTASGGHTSYVWSLTGGGALAYDGANATVEATNGGTYTLSVWAPAGTGWLRSNDATATITAIPSNRVRVSLQANSGKWPVEYVVMQNGEAVATYTQAPGASARIISQVVPTADPVTVLSRQIGISQEETGTWTVNPAGAGPVTTSPEITPIASEEPPAVNVPAPSAPNAQAPTEGNQSYKPVWSSGTTNTDPANQTDLLTNKTFKEGVDKQVENLAGLKADSDERKKDADDAKTAGEGWLSGEKVEEFWNAAQTKLTTIASKDADKLSNLAITSSTVAPIAKASSISLGADIVSGLPGGNFKLEPLAAFPWLETMLTVIREIILWGMGWMFYTAAQKKLEGIQFALSMVPQVDVEPGEKIVIFGTQIPGSASMISLLKRVFVGSVIIGTIHIQIAAAITALNSRMGDIFGGWSFSSVGNIGAAVSTASGPMGTAFRIMDLVFPITASIMYIVAWSLFAWACMLIYGVASAAIKAIKI